MQKTQTTRATLQLHNIETEIRTIIGVFLKKIIVVPPDLYNYEIQLTTTN